jgi:hypothetical protein
MWRQVSKANMGILGGLNDLFCTLQKQKPTIFPNFSNEGTIFAASDYSGQHKNAAYEAYSFVLTTPKRWQSWERHRLEVRSRFLTMRRISFKVLEDKKRWEMLPLFLAAAALLEGVTITILVNKTLGSLFSSSGTLDLNRPELARVSNWKIPVVEKMLRVTHFMALFIAGLSSEGQDLIWITDEDDIVANEVRLREMTTMISEILSSAVEHNMRHFRFGTTASDNGTMQLEDLVSIADLSAGALVEVLTDLESDSKMISSHLFLPIGPMVSRKSLALMTWFTSHGMPMRHIVVALDPGILKGQVNLRRLVFDQVSRDSI